MRKTILICFEFMLFTAMTCTKDSDTQHHRIKFYNASDCDMFIEKSNDYPDTSLLCVQDVTTPGWNLMVQAHTTNIDAFANRDSYEYEFVNIYDTLMVFIFNSDTLALYGWDYVKEHYLIAQRYDLSLEDLQLLNWRLQFPPTEEMRMIRMWPPYGTYDSSGNIIQ